MARGKEHIPTNELRAEVSALTSFGHTQAEIARYLNINIETLVKHYRYEIDNAALIANAKVANKLFNKAVNQDDFNAQKFWLCTKGRWRTADSDAQIQAQSAVQQELLQVRKELEEKNKKEY